MTPQIPSWNLREHNMANNAPIEKITVTVNGKAILLDPENMKYNEASLAEYQSTEYGWVDYLGKQLEYAQKETLIADIEMDAIYSQKFLESKDLGNSDNYAKAVALSNVDVVAAKKHHVACKETVGHLKAHLNAWKGNHSNTQCRSHDLRAEMKMLNRDVFVDDSTGAIDDNTCVMEDFLK